MTLNLNFTLNLNWTTSMMLMVLNWVTSHPELFKQLLGMFG